MLNAAPDTLCANIKKAESMSSYLGLQVTCILGVFHSMPLGSRLATLAVQPQTLERGAQRHKLFLLQLTCVNKIFEAGLPMEEQVLLTESLCCLRPARTRH